MGDQPIMKRARYPVALSAAGPGRRAKRKTNGRVRELPKAQQDITICLVPAPQESTMIVCFGIGQVHANQSLACRNTQLHLTSPC